MTKRIIVAALVLGLAGSAAAQAPKADPKMAKQAETTTDKAAAEVKQVRDEIQKDRNAIVAAAMQLDEKDAAAFWPLYAEYRAAMKPVGDRSTNLILEYAKVQKSLTNEQAAKMLAEFLAIRKLDAETKAAWVPKFQAKLPAKAVLRFFQVENKLDAVVAFQLAAEIPLAE